MIRKLRYFYRQLQWGQRSGFTPIEGIITLDIAKGYIITGSEPMGLYGVIDLGQIDDKP